MYHYHPLLMHHCELENYHTQWRITIPLTTKKFDPTYMYTEVFQAQQQSFEVGLPSCYIHSSDTTLHLLTFCDYSIWRDYYWYRATIFPQIEAGLVQTLGLFSVNYVIKVVSRIATRFSMNNNYVTMPHEQELIKDGLVFKASFVQRPG